MSLAKMDRFPHRKKLVNREIETVFLNTINPMNSKKLVTTFLMDFSFFTHRFFGKNLRKFSSQMGNAPGVCERMYGVQKAKGFFLRELSRASELATLHWSYCTQYLYWIRYFGTQRRTDYLGSVSSGGSTDFRHYNYRRVPYLGGSDHFSYLNRTVLEAQMIRGVQ